MNDIEHEADQNERAQIEAVFLLGGGELEDKPWNGLTGANRYGEAITHTFRYWYEGAPEYAERGLNRAHDYPTFRTVVVWGLPPEALTDSEGKTWTRVAHYQSSGECECPCRHYDGEDDFRSADGSCPLCEAGPGEKHGHVYLGEGWCEVVYMLKEAEENEPQE